MLAEIVGLFALAACHGPKGRSARPAKSTDEIVVHRSTVVAPAIEQNSKEIEAPRSLFSDRPAVVEQILGSGRTVQRFAVPSERGGGLRELYIAIDRPPGTRAYLVLRTVAPDGSTVWLHDLPLFLRAPTAPESTRAEFHDLDGDGQQEILLWTRERHHFATDAPEGEILRVVSWAGDRSGLVLEWRVGAGRETSGALRFGLRVEVHPDAGVCLRLTRLYGARPVSTDGPEAIEVERHVGDFSCQWSGIWRAAPQATLPGKSASVDPSFARLGLPTVHPSARDIPEEIRDRIDPRNVVVRSRSGRRTVLVERLWFDDASGYDSLFLGHTQNYLLALGEWRSRRLVSGCAGEPSVRFSSDERFVALDCLEYTMGHYWGNYTSRVIDLETGKQVAQRDGCKSPRFVGLHAAVCHLQREATSDRPHVEYEKAPRGRLEW